MEGEGERERERERSVINVRGVLTTQIFVFKITVKRMFTEGARTAGRGGFVRNHRKTYVYRGGNHGGNGGGG